MNRCRPPRRRLALALTASVATAALAVQLPRDARADEPSDGEVVALRDLFNAGKELEKESRWAEALDKFKQVGAVKMTPHIRFHIALCEEKLGRWTAAINGFEIAAREALATPKGADDVATNAPLRAEALRKRVPQLTVLLKGTVRTSRVLLDGTPVASALLGTKLPTDPGPHVLEIERAGAEPGSTEKTDRREIELTEGEEESVEFEIHDPEPPPEPPKDEPLPEPPPPEPPPPAQPPPSRVPALVALGTGAACVAGGAVFFGLGRAAISDVRDQCTDGDAGCSPAARPRADEGRTFHTTALVLGGVGAAALVTGTLLYVTTADPPAPKAARRASKPTLHFALGAAGATARLRF